MRVGYILIVAIISMGLTIINVQAEDFHCPDFSKIYDHIKTSNDSYTVKGLTWYCVPDNCNLNNLTRDSDWQTESSFFKPETFELILQCTNIDGTYSIVANAGTDYENCHINAVKLTPGNVLNCNVMSEQKCPDIECNKKQT